jgi:hypothetical protein
MISIWWVPGKGFEDAVRLGDDRALGIEQSKNLEPREEFNNMAAKPLVVFLAFANAEGDLPELREETRQLQEMFEGFAREGRCELVFRPNATLEQILDVLTTYRDRVALFHYGGHADSGRLLLESSLGAAMANAQGLATLLGQQAGLKFVFLNGCSTRPQVKFLLESNVPAVIATARPIDDTIARQLSVAFYSALTKGGNQIEGGRNIRGAFETAKGFIAAGHGERTRDLVAKNPAPEDVADSLGLPWDLFIRPGAQQIERWNLFVNDPLFGLPALPADIHPPARPFRGLQPFSRSEAAVFFGRGKAVRELYDLVTTPGSAPIIFYYGETGVGKSSVLHAGLVPRLEARHQVTYVKRIPELGLIGTLRSVLSSDGVSAPFDLARSWLDREAAVPDGGPLVLILDQAEEVYTRPYYPAPAGRDLNAAAKPAKIDPEAELRELFEALRATFGDASRRPRGKLILGFRKEWLQEFVRAGESATLWVARMPLEPLDRDAMIEAISGPANSSELASVYRLSIEDGLAVVIADDLLADIGSALAPTLQILLSKMWDRAQQINIDAPRFDHALYEGSRSGVCSWKIS